MVSLGQHTCTDIEWSGGESGDPTAEAAQKCSNIGGTALTSCNHAGALGACRADNVHEGLLYSNLVWAWGGGGIEKIKFEVQCENGQVFPPGTIATFIPNP